VPDSLTSSAFFGSNPASKIKSETYQRFARYTAKCGVTRPERGPYCDTVREIDLGEDLIDLAHQPGGINAIKMASFLRTCRLLRVRLVRAPIDGSAPQAGYDYEDLYRF
jgi:hypothetical protein